MTRKAKTPAVPTIATPWGDLPFRLDAAAMAEASSRLGSTDAATVVAEIRADETGIAHRPRFAIFLRAGMAAGIGSPVDVDTGHALLHALGAERARAIILEHAPE